MVFGGGEAFENTALDLGLLILFGLFLGRLSSHGESYSAGRYHSLSWTMGGAMGAQAALITEDCGLTESANAGGRNIFEKRRRRRTT